jgi:porphobilinogen synthase
MLFGITHHKDATGSDSLSGQGLLYRMVSIAKQACADMVVMADTCFCEYTDHGHCGVLDESKASVDNDATLALLGQQAVISAQAGADVIAPSAMMDGQVAAIRQALDAANYTLIPIMSYSTKFASGFYGPFRAAAGCELEGDRKTYQMQPANRREALHESIVDEAEGADILMVKPGMPYLDVLADIRRETLKPLAAYQVSGEYAMIKFAAQAGAIDETAAMLESLIGFKRAGADLILTYFAPSALPHLV